MERDDVAGSVSIVAVRGCSNCCQPGDLVGAGKNPFNVWERRSVLQYYYDVLIDVYDFDV